MQIRSFYLMFAALALFVCDARSASAAPPETFTVDPVHSVVLFRAGHMGVSHTWGRFNEISGVINLDDKNPSDNSIDIKINAASVDTNAAKRDEHLKNPDFLNAKQFPSITFKSTNVKPIDDKTFDVTGMLTLHGVSKPIAVKVEKVGGGKIPMMGTTVGLESTFQIKRSDFDMKNMLEMIPDEVLLIVSIEAGHK